MRMIRAVLEVPPGGYASLYHIAGGIFISVCPFSFMVGFIFPVACRLLIGHRGKGSLEIGWVYVWESIGSLAGGLAISFLLIPRFPPLLVFAWGSLFIFICSFLLTTRFQEIKGLRWLKALLFFLSLTDIIILSSNALPKLDNYLEIIRWKTFHNHLRLIASQDSRYQNLVLAEAQGQYNIFANGNFIGIYPDEYQSAIKAHFFLSQHPEPKRILVMGGGITGLLREILKHPVEAVDYVELDSELVQMIYPVLSPEDQAVLEDSRVTIVYMDGRQYVKESISKYDMIIANCPDPSTALLNRYYTIDFFSESQRILSVNGIFVTGISSVANYVSQEIANYNGSLYQGLKHVFPFVMVIPGDRNYFFASNRDDLISNNPEELSKRYMDRYIHTKNFSPALFEWLVQKDRMEFMESELKQKAVSPLNTDFRPVTYFYNLVIWDMLVGGKDRLQVFQKIQGKRLWWGLVPLGLFFLLGCVLIIAKRSKGVLCWSVFWVISTTGFAGMAVEIVLIFMFQSLYGYVYEKIGIVVALFMLGLAIGSLGMRNRLKRAERIRLKSLAVIEMVICAYVIAIPLMLQFVAEMGYTGKGLWISNEYVYFTLIFAIGLLVGVEFPLVCHVLIDRGYEGGRVAGWIDSMDHVGAGFGAFLTGTLLMPLFGTYITCLIIALLKLTGIGFLGMNIKYGFSK